MAFLPDVGAGSGPVPGLDQAVAKIFGRDVTTPAVDPYKDLPKLLKLYERLKKEASSNRVVFERQWWRSLHFFLGRQWIYYSTRHGEWRDVKLAKWIPKPVTNKIRESGQAFRSTLAKIQLHALARPQGNAELQLITAEVSSELEPTIRTEHEMEVVQDEADFWFTYTGNYFLHLWYDADANPIVTPGLECLMCNGPAPAQATGGMAEMALTCSCGGQQFGPSMKFATIRGKGRGRTDVCGPLEILLPPNAISIEGAPYLIRMRWRDKDYYENTFDREFTKGLQFSKAPTERSLQLFRTLSTQNDLSGSTTIFGPGGTSQETEGIAEYELWLKPTREYPGGLVLRVVGDSNPKIVENPDEGLPGPFPLMTLEGRPIFPWVHAQFERVGGRVWGGAFVDPAIQKQIQLNQLDSFIQLAFQRMSNPIWLEPKGAEVEKLTGEPGLVVKWNPLGAQGLGKPERLAGENIPSSLFTIREQYLRDIEDLLGTYDVMKGGKPPNVEAYSAIQALIDQSQGRFSRCFLNRGEAYRKWYEIALELERAYGPEERLINILGPNNEWSSKVFKNAQLSGGIAIVVEDGTQAPKTALGYRATLEHANQLGVLQVQNPETQYEVLRGLGLTKLVPGLDADVREAVREQEAFEEFVKSGGQSGEDLIRQPWHNDQIHLAQNRKWMNSDRFRELLKLNPLVAQAADLHLQQHFLALSGMMGLGGAPAPSGALGPGVGGGSAMAGSARESTQGNEPGDNMQRGPA